MQSARPFGALIRTSLIVLATLFLLPIALAGASESSDTRERPANFPRAEPDSQQKQMIADNRVTHAEMTAALERVVACTIDAGYNAELVSFRPKEGWQLSAGAEDMEGVEAENTAMDECYARMAREAETIYLDTHALSPAERAMLQSRIEACLDDKGIEVVEGSGASGSDDLSYSTEHNDCATKARRDLGI